MRPPLPMTPTPGPGGSRELGLQERRAIARAAKRRDPTPIYIGLSLVTVLVIWLGAWTIESTLNSGKTARGIEVAGQEVGRLSDIQLDEALVLQDLAVPPGNRLEALKGDRLGQHAIRINRQWRICFRWTGSDAEEVEICDYH